MINPSGTPELVWDLQAELAEGPVWSDRDRALWFVDIKGHALHRYGEGGECRTWAAPDQIGFVLPADDGSLVCGVRSSLQRFDLTSGRFEVIARVEPDRPQNRLNDGFAAPDGSLWFGSMDDSEKTVSGALYRYNRGEITRQDDGYRVTNGPALSPDGRTLYHNDTTRRRIYAFSHDGGALDDKRVFAEVDDGFPDGMAVDAEGVVYVGLFNGWGVARFAPGGERLDTLRFPVCTITKPAFGGDDLRWLYCTTAWLGNGDLRANQPTLGGLFRLRVGTPGLPQALVRL